MVRSMSDNNEIGWESTKRVSALAWLAGGSR